MSHHTTSFNSLGGGHTYTYVNFLDNNNFKKLGNSGVELNLVVDEITVCCQILFHQHWILALKTLNAYTLISKHIFE